MTTLTVHGRAVRLRPATAADTPLLVEVYAAGRADELDRASWQPGQREAFERMQFDLQDRQYRTAHPQGSFDVVEVDGQPAGRLYVSERSEDIRIVDIALLPVGAYDPRPLLREVHTDPEEAVAACLDVGARVMAPMHWGTFLLSAESPVEPLTRVRAAWQAAGRPREELWDLPVGGSRVLRGV